MKKKLLPFILGCAMVAAMPLAAQAQTTVEYANEIPTSGQTPGGVNADKSKNGFTEYNDVTTTENTVEKVFGSDTGSIGNTRNANLTMQTSYPVALRNEKQGYRATSHTLAQDIADDNTNFNEATDTQQGIGNDTAGTTDLETSIPEFDMKIPASTVLPLGATRWRIGNVEINGTNFVRPDKIDVVTTHEDFKHTDYDDSETPAHKTAHSIAFTVTDKRYTSTDIESADKYYFQDGTGYKQSVFPYAYTQYTSSDYQNGLVSEINETHQVWVLTSDWTDKTPGKYTGTITFNAEVVTTDSADMYSNLYPGEGQETQS